ncbi:MAG: hypothetical protein VYB05_08380 [Pseudomonadota bacterium]|nr:hypothetical protein [Pseudomonadota bacterium]
MRHLCAALLILLFAANDGGAAASSAASSKAMPDKAAIAIAIADDMSGCVECPDMDSMAGTCEVACVSSFAAIPPPETALPLPDCLTAVAMGDRGMPSCAGPPERHPPR